MRVSTTSPSWQLIGRIQPLVGHGYASRYPALVVRLEGEPLSADVKAALWAALRASCPTMERSTANLDPTQDWPQSVQWLLASWQALQVGLGLPVYEVGRLLGCTSNQARCIVPTFGVAQAAMARVVRRTLEWLRAVSSGDDSATAQAYLDKAIQALRAHSAKGSNVPRFVKAAYELGIPIQELPGGVYQYGVGRRARWLDSSFTDVTPNISAKLARNKVMASALLRQAGLSVPAHQLVANADQAVKAAHTLGYPVVVKPADMDGGVGVAAGLLNDEEVIQAYKNASKHSRHILLEKHVEGCDYRITVFNGVAIWAIERVPAGVTGDGSQSVAELIATTNADPRRGTGKHAPLQRLQIDEESDRLLEMQGLKATSIPPAGQFVRLRRAANVASGGTPVAVFDRLHPDNARLAVRAAEVLRLDLAGIDLLIPDITVSWRESGAAICEVNGQPNLGQTTAAHLYGAILRQLLPEGGRIPTIWVFGAKQTRQWLQALSRQLAATGMSVGVAGNGEVCVNGETIHQGAATTYAAGKMLALHRNVDAMVLAVEDDSVLQTGMPVDRCDALILAGANVKQRQERNRESHQRWMAELLRSLLPACDGVVVAPKIGELKLQGFRELSTATWHEMEGAVPLVCAQTVEMVKALVKSRHADERWGAA